MRAVSTSSAIARAPREVPTDARRHIAAPTRAESRRERAARRSDGRATRARRASTRVRRERRATLGSDANSGWDSAAAVRWRFDARAARRRP
jgi:hypothetical protein